MIRLGCPKCDNKLKFDEGNAGKKAKCPRCGHSFHLPSPEGESDAAQEQRSDERVRIKCPHCSTIFRAEKVLIGRNWNCRHCEQEFVPEEYSKEAEHLLAALETLAGLSRTCQACHEEDDEPTRYVKYNMHIGLVILFYHRSIHGNLCKECRSTYFWDYTIATAVFGWWGIISFVAAPIVVFTNVIQHLQSKYAPTVSPFSGAAQKVRPYSTGLLVTGLLNLLSVFFFLALIIFSPGPKAAENRLPIGVWLTVSLLSAGVTITGALRMRKLRSYRLAILSCILAMIPGFSMCFIVGIPMGLLALTVLRRSEVRSEFT